MKRILIVDDDPAFSDIFTIVFQTYGFYVDRLNEVNKLFELKDNLPDVIILDTELSDLDATEACKFLRSQSTRQVPLILMIGANSGTNQPDAIAGADFVVEKPFDMRSLVRKVDSLISKYAHPLPV